MLYYNGDLETPFHYEGSLELSFNKKIIMSTNQKCAPGDHWNFKDFYRTSLKGKGDWLCTDLGSFLNKGQSGRIMTVEKGTISNSVRLPRRVQDWLTLEMGQYVVMTTYWKHAKYTDFCRMTTVIHNHDISVANYALAQYYSTGEHHKVSPIKKNRCNKPFHPTMPSTFQFIKENARRLLGPGTVFDWLLKKQEE